ncbi:MAG: hypothetical protein LBV52_05100, partial [Spirochaetaceae bacterium]|nr:hypothetical protein [Spirochaetaceae bacterium]
MKIGKILFLVCAPLFAAENSISVVENFDGKIDESTSIWKGNVSVTNAVSEIQPKDIESFENKTRFAKFDLSVKGAGEVTLTRVDVKEPSIFSFRYRTETVSKIGQLFTVYVDDVLKSELAGINVGWRTERIKLEAGSHEVRFESVNIKGVKIVNSYNAVYIDDLTVFPDVIASIEVRPRGVQDTYIGASLRFKTEALLPDGSVKTDVELPIYSAMGGSINSDGVFLPLNEGQFKVTAILNNFVATSDVINVHSARSE